MVSGIGKIVDVCRRDQGWQVVSDPMKEPLEESIRDVLVLIPSQVLKSEKKRNEKKLKKFNYEFLRQHVKTNEKKESKIIKALKKGKLVAASDGSAYAKVRATFAFCFAKRKTGKKLYKAFSPVLMDPEYSNSDRAELCGLLAIVAQLLELGLKAKKWINSKEKRKVVIYTDSASSITLIEKKYIIQPKP